MSRAFVKEDDGDRPGPRWPLPSSDDPGYALAVARALLEAARIGEIASAEAATGTAWGAPHLVAEVTQLRDEAIEREDDRLETVANRYLRAVERAEPG